MTDDSFVQTIVIYLAVTAINGKDLFHEAIVIDVRDKRVCASSEWIIINYNNIIYMNLTFRVWLDDGRNICNSPKEFKLSLIKLLGWA